VTSWLHGEENSCLATSRRGTVGATTAGLLTAAAFSVPLSGSATSLFAAITLRPGVLSARGQAGSRCTLVVHRSWNSTQHSQDVKHTHAVVATPLVVERGGTADSVFSQAGLLAMALKGGWMRMRCVAACSGLSLLVNHHIYVRSDLGAAA
jgi:hypothetical protein